MACFSLSIGRTRNLLRQARRMFPESVRRGWIVSAALVTVVALVIRVIAISRYGFDGDEVFSLEAANATWAHLLSVAANDKSHPPLFYAALKLWLELGPPEEGWVRLLSVFFGAALVPISAVICRLLRLSTADIALVLILTAINGLLTYYSQHARMFALFDFCAAVSILSFIYFITTPGSLYALCLLTATNIIMVYSHYWGWSLIFPEVFITIAAYRAMLARFVLSISIVAVSFLPWAVVAGIAASRQRGLSQQIAWMGSDVAGTTSYVWLFASFNGIVDFNHATTSGIALFMAPICVFVIYRAKNHNKSIWDPGSPLFWITIIATPLVLTSLGSYITKQNLWSDRHLSIIAVPYFILVGLSITSLPSPFIRIAFRCALLAWAIVASSASLAETDKKFHWETMAKEIAARDPAPIYAAEDFIALPLEYHLGHSAGRMVRVRENPNLPEISDRQFWFVYRNLTWHGQQPQDQLQALCETIDALVSTQKGKQEIRALLVHKKAKATTVGAPHFYAPSQ